MNEIKTNKTARSLTGVVVSSRRDKTIAVKISRKVKHPLYGKYINRSTKLHAHDAENKAGIGDEVSIAETRPISKTKFFELIEIKKKAGE